MNKKIVSVLIVLAALFIAAPAFAQTAVLNLQGTVAAALEISIVPEAVAGTLDLSASQTDLFVATVTERSNRSGGYEVTVASANGGILDGALTADFVAYTLSYNGVDFGQPTVAPILVTDTLGKTAGTGNPKIVNISYTIGTMLFEDTYTDTLTFTIAAK